MDFNSAERANETRHDAWFEQWCDQADAREALGDDVGTQFKTASPDELCELVMTHGDADTMAALFAALREAGTYPSKLPPAVDRAWDTLWEQCVDSVVEWAEKA